MNAYGICMEEGEKKKRHCASNKKHCFVKKN